MSNTVWSFGLGAAETVIYMLHFVGEFRSFSVLLKPTNCQVSGKYLHRKSFHRFTVSQKVLSQILSFIESAFIGNLGSTRNYFEDVYINNTVLRVIKYQYNSTSTKILVEILLVAIVTLVSIWYIKTDVSSYLWTKVIQELIFPKYFN